jgi:hypothetical protein
MTDTGWKEELKEFAKKVIDDKPDTIDDFEEVIPEYIPAHIIDKKYKHAKPDYTPEQLKEKVDTILHPEVIKQPKVPFKDGIEVPKMTPIPIDDRDHETIRRDAKDIELNKLTKNMRTYFPKVRCPDSEKTIESLKNNPTCLTCRFYAEQSKKSEVKEKLRGGSKMGWGDGFKFRIYKNKDERLNKTKGYCCVPISMARHIKTLINNPDISLCEDHQLHPNIQTYINAVTDKLHEMRETKKRIEAKERELFLEKEKALQVVKAYNQTHRQKTYPER